MRFIPGNAQHIGSRTEQQDSFGFSDPEDTNFLGHGGFLAVLADGAGGMEHGQSAGRLAVKTFLRAYQEKPEDEGIAAALERALLEANNAVQALADQENSIDNVGSTLVAAVLHENDLYWISVGDSAVYLYRDQTLSLLTTSHIYAHQLDQEAAMGRISKDAALSHPDRDALTSYIGKKNLEEIDRNTTPVAVLTGDRIALASDGLFKTLNVEEISTEIRDRDPQRACESLVQKVLEKGREHQDNVTVLCVDVQNEEEDKTRSSQSQPNAARSRLSAWLTRIIHRETVSSG